MSGGGAFFDQFIEDYHAECEEHLGTARRVLLGLEEDAALGAPDPQRLRELFRSLHTLKGLSGMVGDACAERVAHALEESLRTAERRAATFTPAFVDALFAGVDLLARCVEARRTGAESPDVDAALAALHRLAPPRAADPAVERPAPAPAASSAPAAPVAAALPDPVPAGEGTVWAVEFVPSVALTARGIGVDAVRTRLRELGTLLDARPRMVAGGVAFDFRVRVPAGQSPDPAWAADGMTWMPEEPVPAPAAAADAPRGAAAVTPIAAASSSVRVDLARLDDVMRLLGELVVSRSRLDELLAAAARDGLPVTLDALGETNDVLERQLRRLREGIMRIRLVPVGEVFERLRFAARDAIRESGKQVTLAFHGQQTEIDKLVVDRMLEPLLHLVRNAVSHGIEAPDVRRAHGKPGEGTLALRATASGDRILIEVEDDGAGIDVARVAARARARGMLPEARGAADEGDDALAGEALLDILCAPGFSTRDEADMTSGRGVGMEVVRSAIRALSGSLAVDTVPGRGTRWRIELPLTLMILDALMVQVGGQQMAVPQPSLREILQVEAGTVVTFENNEVIPYRGGVLPLLSLPRLFDLPVPTGRHVYALVVGDTAPVGLVVDRLVGLREIVVHPIADPLVSRPGIAGATELGDGRVSLILDTAALLRMGQARSARVHAASPLFHHTA